MCCNDIRFAGLLFLSSTVRHNQRWRNHGNQRCDCFRFGYDVHRKCAARGIRFMHDDEVRSFETMIWIWCDISCFWAARFYFYFRSSRTEPPDLVGIMRVTDDMIDSLVCPPPPSEPPAMSEEMINELIVPAPGWSKHYFWPLFDRIINVFHIFVVLKKCTLI